MILFKGKGFSQSTLGKRGELFNETIYGIAQVPTF